MKKLTPLIGALALALSACGGGSPSKDEVCAPCASDSFFAEACSDAYDTCENTSGCKLSDLKDVQAQICSSP